MKLVQKSTEIPKVSFQGSAMVINDTNTMELDSSIIPVQESDIIRPR